MWISSVFRRDGDGVEVDHAASAGHRNDEILYHGRAMSAAPFDTLKYAEALKAAGVPDVQAKAQAEALADALREGGRELVTKADLKVAIAELKAEIQAMLNRQLLTLTGIIIGSMVAMTGIFAAIVKLL